VGTGAVTADAGRRPAVAVTGATGRLGSRVARRLAAADVPQLLVVRDPARAPKLPGASVARAEFRDADAVRAAVAGVPTVLMVSAGENVDRLQEHYAFVDAVAAGGVEHVVYISFAGASPDATFTLVRDHWATEQRIRESGLRWTFVRDNLYADFFPLMVGVDGALRGPAGDGRVAAVGQDDIADAVAAILRSPRQHAGETYTLTGPAAMTLDEAARVMTGVVGREIRYVRETVDEAYASRSVYGAPDWQVAAWVSTYTAIAAGDLAEVTGDVERLAGHPPMSLGEVLRSDPSTYENLTSA
jgi:uncharacterized protein YbjT (DUF2867 family)